MTKVWLKTIGFMVIPLVVIGLLEHHARKSQAHFWYDAAGSYLVKHQAKFLFVGTSRVFEAIDTRSFLETLEQSQQLVGSRMNAVNLGMGYGTIQEHFFGLRKLLTYNPKCFQHTIVMIEAPAGMPDSGKWSDDWLVFPQFMRQLAAYLDWTDVMRYCQLERVPVSTKIAVIFGKLSPFLARASGYHEWILSRLDERVANWCARTFSPTTGKSAFFSIQSPPSENQRISSARRGAFAHFNAQLLNQRPVDWETTVVRDIVALVAKNGGRVCFFEIPLSPMQERLYLTDVRQHDRRAFVAAARRWECSIVSPVFPITVSDFPDVWHLRRTRSAEYSSTLARSLLEQTSFFARTGSK